MTKKINKIDVKYDTANNHITIYVLNDSVLMIKENFTSYYKIGDYFYNRKGEQEAGAAFLDRMKRYKMILRTALLIEWE